MNLIKKEAREWKDRMGRVCANCGHQFGKHAARDDACPVIEENVRVGWHLNQSFSLVRDVKK